MKTTLSEGQFEQLGEDMKTAWDRSAEDGSLWVAFETALQPGNMCARWYISGEGSVHLLLEEHTGVLDAFWAARRNDGSVDPLRRTSWCKTGEGWVRP